MKHTPGPWGCNGSTNSEEYQIIAAEGGVGWQIALVLPGEEISANARLIAAAPELLEACKRLLLILGMHSMECDNPVSAQAAELIFARAAIAKATE